MVSQEDPTTPFALVLAVFGSERLDRVESALEAAGIGGITVSCAKGYGEYANFFSPDPHVPVVRVEVFAPRADVDQVVHTITSAASSGQVGDGVVAVLPLERFLRVRMAS